MEKSVILLQIKVALGIAMTEEIRMRKKGITTSDEFVKAVAQKTVSRAIISMIPELGKKPQDATDDDIIKLLKKYISQEKERTLYELSYLKEADVHEKSASEVKKLVSNKIQDLGTELTSHLIEIAQTFLPKQATEEEIVLWINENIDMTQYENKMQAMGPIMKEFKGCDGNFVKSILIDL